MTEAIQKLTPIEAINEFYNLKDKYKSGYYDKYIKPIINNEKKSKREKRVEYSKLPKHECINCKRNVETIFTITNDAGIRKFIAKCGDLISPCPLDIQIDYSKREQYYEAIKYGLNNIEILKLDIIKEKNNALFFEKNNDTISNFEKLTESLKNETELTGILIEQDILTNDNPVKAELLKNTIDEFGKAFLIPFKKMVSEYVDTGSELILNRAIQFYVDEMVPKLKEIQGLRYDVNFVDYNEEMNEYTLIQKPNSLENKTHMFEEDDKVIKFIKGMPNITKTKTKTKKATNVETTKNKTTKNKTRKSAITLELVDELPEEQGQQPVQQPVQVPVQQPVQQPVQEQPLQQQQQPVQQQQQPVQQPVQQPGQQEQQEDNNNLQLKFKEGIVDNNPIY